MWFFLRMMYRFRTSKERKLREHPTNLNSPGKWPFKHCVRVSAFFVDCSMLLNCMAWSWHWRCTGARRASCTRLMYVSGFVGSIGLDWVHRVYLFAAGSSDEGAGTRKTAAHWGGEPTARRTLGRVWLQISGYWIAERTGQVDAWLVH